MYDQHHHNSDAYYYPEKKIGHIKSFFELEADDIDKQTIKFDEFKGKVTVITNVASYCGKLVLNIFGIGLLLHWIIIRTKY